MKKTTVLLTIFLLAFVTLFATERKSKIPSDYTDCNYGIKKIKVIKPNLLHFKKYSSLLEYKRKQIFEGLDSAKVFVKRSLEHSYTPYLPLTGGNMTGLIHIDVDYNSAGLEVKGNDDPYSGSVVLVSGSTSTTGYINFYRADEARVLFIGYDETNPVYYAEQGYHHFYSNVVFENYVGIGTTSPQDKLHVKNGQAILEGTNTGMQFRNSDASNDFQFGLASGSGAFSQFAQNRDFFLGKVNSYGNFYIGNQYGGDIVFTTGASGYGSESKVMTIFNNGKVGIGTGTTSLGTHTFGVNGSAIFTEVVVKTIGTWPDYVFKNNYKLLSLEELAKYVKQYNHLPNIPSSSEMQNGDGIELGQITNKLLEKIEEVTLYLIDLKKENTELKKEIELLKKDLRSHK